MSQGRKPVAVVFWYSRKRERILVGCPEEYPIPPVLKNEGFEKIVCRSARQVEIWSQKMRDQDRRDQELSDEEREATEGPIRRWMRADLVYRRDHARNAFNRDFCQAALDKLDAHEKELKEKLSRVSYMHAEAFEEKKH